MEKTIRAWDSGFVEYMEEMVGHPNYKGMPIRRNAEGELLWLTELDSESQERLDWAQEKADELEMIVQPREFAQLMREIHPTKIHVCKVCGSRMSIYHHYPTKHLLKTLNKEFKQEFSENDHIGDIWDKILANGEPKVWLRQFFQRTFGLSDIRGIGKNEIITMCEKICSEQSKRLLSPGATTNFPRVFDGYQPENRCCIAGDRAEHLSETLGYIAIDQKTYKFWNDGNLHGANAYSKSKHFEDKTVRHMGPVALGFVHDPRYLRTVEDEEQPAIRNRLLVEDIEAIIQVESSTGVPAMSWYSSEMWMHIKKNYMKNPQKVSTIYRNALLQNSANYFFIIKSIAEKSNGYGRDFLIDAFLDPKSEVFEFTYEFDAWGNITERITIPYTKNGEDPAERYVQEALEAIGDYSERALSHLLPDMTYDERFELSRICWKIGQQEPNGCQKALSDLVISIEKRLTQEMRTAKSPKV